MPLPPTRPSGDRLPSGPSPRPSFSGMAGMARGRYESSFILAPTTRSSVQRVVTAPCTSSTLGEGQLQRRAITVGRAQCRTRVSARSIRTHHLQALTTNSLRGPTPAPAPSTRPPTTIVVLKLWRAGTTTPTIPLTTTPPPRHYPQRPRPKPALNRRGSEAHHCQYGRCGVRLSAEKLPVEE